jgi:hypothetical protein
MEETSMTALDKVINAERILNEWLTDNTEEVFEEQPEIDTARDMLNEAIEELSRSLIPKGYAMIHESVLRKWNVLDQVKDACVYPINKDKP